MKAIVRQTRVAFGVLWMAGVAAGPAAVAAQRTRAAAGSPDAPRLLVHTLRSKEKGLGNLAADAIRSRLAQDFSSKQLGIIDKNTIESTLEASGFPPKDPPDAVTANLLAKQLRADEYLEGDIEKAGSGFRARVNMVLARDRKMVQPLPVAEGPRMLDMATALSHSIQDARKQLADERKCETSIADNKLDEAVSAAQAAIAAYPKSTIARVCLAQALVNKKAPTDSILAVTRQVTELDANNLPALQLQVAALRQATPVNEENVISAYGRLTSLDPTNARLVQEYVEFLGSAKRPELAIPIIDSQLVMNPDDAQLTRLQFLLLLSGRDFKRAATSGENLLKTSPDSMIDTLFFTRLTAAYAADSQPQKAAEAAARGVAKFPNVAGMHSLYGAALKAAGQTAKAVEEQKRALQIDPKVQGGYTNLGLTYLDLNQPDSAVAAFRQAVANNEDKARVGQALLAQGARLYQAAAQSKAIDDFKKAIPILALSDTVAPSPNAKFFLGVSSFSIGAQIAQSLQQGGTCDQAKDAQARLLVAQLNVPAGGATQPQAAAQIMGSLGQVVPYVDAQVKRLCK